MRRILLHSGTVVTSQGMTRLDILIQGDKIAALADPARPPSADERVDVSGNLVFPGFIDPHVHSRDPGQTEKETFEHSTTAAAAGGLTMLMEMPNAVPPVTSAAVLRERAQEHEAVSRVDFGLWGMALGAPNLEELPGLFGAGSVAVKLFMGYGFDERSGLVVTDPRRFDEPGVLPPPSIAEIHETFEQVAQVNGVVGVHCEDMEILGLMAARASAGHKPRSYQEVAGSRPPSAEALAVAIIIELARATGCRAHVVHTSTGRSVELVRQAQAAGVSVTAETCPHYLTLTADLIDEHEHPVKVFPPVRGEADQEALWQGVRDGTIPSVGSDHAPHTVAQKTQPLVAQPPGAIGVETMVRVLLHEALAGRVGLTRLASVLATDTARLYGIYPRKGTLLPGADADISVVDPEVRWEIRNEHLNSKECVSPWHGFRGRGAVIRSFLRGEPLLTEDGLANPRGRFVPAAHDPAWRSPAGAPY